MNLIQIFRLKNIPIVIKWYKNKVKKCRYSINENKK